MRDADRVLLVEVARTASGLVLDRGNMHLLDFRVPDVAHRTGYATVDDFADALRTAPRARREALQYALVESLVTGETSFFRDPRAFRELREYALPHAMSHRAMRGRLRIWSCACSTGQEPFSIAMELQEARELLSDWSVEVIATDISATAIAKASSGSYEDYELRRGLSIEQRSKYFVPISGGWTVAADVRRWVTFLQHNLLDSLAPPGHFDIVFCRNVLIYFDRAMRRSALRTIRAAMPDWGLLFLGGAETVLGVSDDFRMIPGHVGLYAAEPCAPVKRAAVK